MGVNEYKEMQKRLTLMYDREWLNTIDGLKNFKYDDSKNYTVTYLQGQQRKNRRFKFHSVQFIEETKMFIFTSYRTDWETGDLTEEVYDKITLKDIEIITYAIEDQPKAEDYIF